MMVKAGDTLVADLDEKKEKIIFSLKVEEQKEEEPSKA
jgi:hypothetical protein